MSVLVGLMHSAGSSLDQYHFSAGFSILGFLARRPMAFQHVQGHCMVWSIGSCPRLATKSKLFNINFTFIVIFNFVKVLGKPTWSPCETMSFKEAG